MSRGRDPLHQREVQERLDLGRTLFEPLVPDALGEPFHLLFRDLQPRQDLQVLAAAGKRRVLGPGMDNLAEHMRAVGALINPQTPGLSEKQRPRIWGSNAWVPPNRRGLP